MDQAKLTKISDTIATGDIVEGWGGERYKDIHVLRRITPDELWARRAPDGEWAKLPGMGDANKC